MPAELHRLSSQKAEAKSGSGGVQRLQQPTGAHAVMNSEQFIVLGSVFTLRTWMEQCSLSAGARRPREGGCSYVHCVAI